MRCLYLILGIAFRAAAHDLPDNEIISKRFADPTTREGYITVNAHVDRSANVIRFHIPETGFFEDVETLEDYDLESAEAEDKGTLNVKAVEFEDAQELVGEKIMEFCDGLPIYKIGRFEGDEEENVDEDEEEEEARLFDGSKKRQSVTFRKCFGCLFFVIQCFTFTVTIPTGLPFFFFFFG